MRYDLVIFDNDGVLVDSEPISNRILAECLTEAGYPTTTEESVRDFMGAAMHRVHDVVWERAGERLPAGFDADYHGRVFAAFERELVAVEGAATVVEKLAADGVPYCLASSAGHERIRVALRKTGLYRLFGEERIFSAQDVGRGKPAPDLFLHAARTMGVPPERCAVVEDSALGVAAARAAGMDVYGYTGMTPPAKLADATELFGQMAELPALLLG
ncbi:HAD family hydrolase [Actinacidiphila epipremni]|uniref:HAD family hydrolase n=1 Tax=Actinacidiphila epipremni TaxID=2053013 RepID=A0ABX1A2S9_9ACTN|nr:HAD family hydrolase [Actinacidiphila epipremni]NJP48224.1 HAD family hydrolase [Actinacidiphila epipremni]